MGVAASQRKVVMTTARNMTDLLADIEHLKHTVSSLQKEKEKLKSDKLVLQGENSQLQSTLDSNLKLLPVVLERLEKLERGPPAIQRANDVSIDKNKVSDSVTEAEEPVDDGSDKISADKSVACPVMISLNVKTMRNVANDIKTFLNRNKIGVWMCTGMEGGVLFRDEIVKAVEECDVFLALLNDSWAQSGECRYEFEYAQRLSLTKGKPKIVPVLFHDLDWNAYSHVRLLLANTNGILYNEGEEVKARQRIFHAIENAGVRSYGSFRDKAPSAWTAGELAKFLNDVLLRRVEQANMTGKDFVSMAPDNWKKKLKFSNDQVELIQAEIKGEVADKFQGSYWIRGHTENNYDSNKTESNIFSVTLQNFGLASSGNVWGCGTKHSNYNKVTCVWQGSYTEDGEVEFEARYSNNTHETYSGSIDGLNLHLNYLWYGYGRKSSGKAEFTLQKKSPGDVNELTKETW